MVQAKKYEHVNKTKDTKTHLFTGLVRCPICGAGMYGNKTNKYKNGEKYREIYYYGCKHRDMTRGHKCDYKRQILEDPLDLFAVEVITKLVANPRFASLMREKINMQVDTAAIEQEISTLERQLKLSYAVKKKTLEEIENLDPDEGHYKRIREDLDDRFYRMYDRIDEQEQCLIEAMAKKRSIEADKVTGDNIYKVLIYFEKLYSLMSEEEKRKLMEALIQVIQIYEDQQPNGQWLKSITFRLPIIDGDMKIPVNDGLDKNAHVKTVCLLRNRKIKPDSYVTLDLDAEEYYRIKDGEKV